MDVDQETRDFETVDAMLTFGGSFVQALGAAFRAGDPRNRARLRDAFPDYFTQYEELAQLRKKRQQ